MEFPQTSFLKAKLWIILHHNSICFIFTTVVNQFELNFREATLPMRTLVLSHLTSHERKRSGANPNPYPTPNCSSLLAKPSGQSYGWVAHSVLNHTPYLRLIIARILVEAEIHNTQKKQDKGLYNIRSIERKIIWIRWTKKNKMGHLRSCRDKNKGRT